MVKYSKPLAGSRGFWPKKRAKRIFPRVRFSQKYPKAVPVAFAAYKAGMVSVSYMDPRKESATKGQEIVEAATVLEAPPLKVIGIKLYRLAYSALIDSGTVWAEGLPKDLSRAMSIPKNPRAKERLEKFSKLEGIHDLRILACTQPKDAGFKKAPEVFELPVGGDLKAKWEYAKQKLGREISAKEIFEESEPVDVIAVTKGKGYQGPVKRFGVKIRPRKSEGKRRHVGSLGPWHPARVLPGKIAMAGQLGFQTRTEHNKKIVRIGSDGLAVAGGMLHYGQVKGDYMLVLGSVPGSRKRLVFLRKPVRNYSRPVKIEVKKVFSD
ncbi:MAG: 50S ribosomal protein L3 [Candidatus Aenigmarchaeota archaeon]|nr:50S ribosomal protein L3 [Candidatus Aenigmarchaeota archaeon]